MHRVLAQDAILGEHEAVHVAIGVYMGLPIASASLNRKNAGGKRCAEGCALSEAFRSPHSDEQRVIFYLAPALYEQEMLGVPYSAAMDAAADDIFHAQVYFKNMIERYKRSPGEIVADVHRVSRAYFRRDLFRQMQRQIADELRAYETVEAERIYSIWDAMCPKPATLGPNARSIVRTSCLGSQDVRGFASYRDLALQAARQPIRSLYRPR